MILFLKRAGRWKKKKKNKGFPRQGGDFVAPGKNLFIEEIAC
jgi:hypothetical protein